MTDEDWAAAAEGQRVRNSWCPDCRRSKFGPAACKCPGSGMFAGTPGPLNLGIERTEALTARNEFKVFYEEFVLVTERPTDAQIKLLPDVWDQIANAAVGTTTSPSELAERFDVPEHLVEERLGERRIETCAACGWWFKEPVGAEGDPTCEDCK